VKKTLVAFALTLPVAAQMPGGLPEMRHVTMAPGSSIDLDSGVLLPAGDHGRLRADVKFGRDGLGFFLQPLREGMAARASDDHPAGDWFEERLRIPRRGGGRTWAFVKTDHGVARVSVAIVDPYSTAAAVVSWTVVPPTDPVFLPAPTDLRLRWHEGKLLVSWEGSTPQFLCEVITGKERKKQVCSVNGCEFEGLAEDGVHRVRVRGMQGGAISVPAEAVQHGERKGSVYEVTQYPDRWYDQEGGLGLSAGADQAEGAEVVFYLYGVYVPGGGVQKVGNGRDAFLSIGELPTSGYLPTYDRLDDGDVHAVRLPDGRRALLWLEPTKVSDVRSGMNVHSVFLPDGRGRLLLPPQPTATTEQRVVTLAWPRVEGAKGYEVRVGGGKPVRTDKLTATFAGLPRDRMHVFTVRSVGADGGWSLSRTVRGHTFGAGAVLGRVKVSCSEDHLDLATGKAVKAGDFAVVGSAGGGGGLTLMAPHGSTPSGGRDFGDFAKLERSQRITFDCDDHAPDQQQFFVWTKDGGCACVRIVKRGYPVTEWEYVYLPSLPK